MKITRTTLKNLPPPGNQRRTFWDDSTPGFGITQHVTGKVSYVSWFRIGKKATMKTLGDASVLSPERAKALHAEFRAQATLGVDLAEQIRLDTTKGRTFGDVLDHYIERHLPTKRPISVATDKANIEKYLRPRFGKTEIETIDAPAIAKFFHELRDKPVQANRLLALLSKVFSLAVFEKFCTSNPCKGIRKNPEHHRERFLTVEEGERLRDALAHFEGEAYETVQILRLIIFTGCRKGEAINATWAQFDLENGVWTKPASNTKQKRVHRVPLAEPARELLSALKSIKKPKRADMAVFDYSAAGKITALKRLWPKICKHAGLEDFRIHDCRHSFAATLLSKGRSLPTVGKLLGHSQASTTKRYEHLADEALRDALSVIE